MYNETLMENTTNIFDIATAVNSTTSYPNLFIIMFLIVLWIIFFVVAIFVINPIRSFTFSSFIISIITGLLWAIGEINETLIIIPFSLFIIGLFMVIFSEN